MNSNIIKINRGLRWDWRKTLREGISSVEEIGWNERTRGSPLQLVKACG
jgi:hypothetical protein